MPRLSSSWSLVVVVVVVVSLASPRVAAAAKVPRNPKVVSRERAVGVGLERVRRAVAAREFDQALTLANEQLPRTADLPNVQSILHRLKALTFLERNSPDTAVSTAKGLTVVAPSDALAFVNLTEIALLAGQLAEAQAAAKRAQELAPDSYAAKCAAASVDTAVTGKRSVYVGCWRTGQLDRCTAGDIFACHEAARDDLACAIDDSSVACAYATASTPSNRSKPLLAKQCAAGADYACLAAVDLDASADVRRKVATLQALCDRGEHRACGAVAERYLTPSVRAQLPPIADDKLLSLVELGCRVRGSTCQAGGRLFETGQGSITANLATALAYYRAGCKPRDPEDQSGSCSEVSRVSDAVAKLANRPGGGKHKLWPGVIVLPEYTEIVAARCPKVGEHLAGHAASRMRDLVSRSLTEKNVRPADISQAALLNYETLVRDKAKAVYTAACTTDRWAASLIGCMRGSADIDTAFACASWFHPDAYASFVKAARQVREFAEQQASSGSMMRGGAAPRSPSPSPSPSPTQPSPSPSPPQATKRVQSIDEFGDMWMNEQLKGRPGVRDRRVTRVSSSTGISSTITTPCPRSGTLFVAWVIPPNAQPGINGVLRRASGVPDSNLGQLQFVTTHDGYKIYGAKYAETVATNGQCKVLIAVGVNAASTTSSPLYIHYE